MLSRRPCRRPLARRQKGLSIVELMVGVAVGLIVVAGATVLVSTQLVENRRLLVETQLQQDLRAASDIIARELRRAGTQTESQALKNLWYEGTTVVTGSQRNIYSGLVSTPSASVVNFYYNPSTGGADGPFGFRLNSGVIETRLANANWQPLTDGNVMNVTAFTVTPVNRAALKMPCPKPCPGGGGTACWPSVQVRELTVAITAAAKSLPGVDRTISSTVRLRGDYVRFYDPVNNLICPP